MSESAVCNAIRDWRMPSHHELSTVLAVLAAKVKDNGALGDSVKTSVVEMLDELADEIDQDLVNQNKEQQTTIRAFTGGQDAFDNWRQS